MSELKIGLVGLDTSHCTAFTRLLNDPAQEHHVPGGRVVAGWPGGSPDFALSHTRVEGFVAELRSQHGVEILETPEAVAERSDALMITAADGRIHCELMLKVLPYGKPIFVDKPFSTSVADAAVMAGSAREAQVPIMSCSALRFAPALTEMLDRKADGKVTGADVYGPLAMEQTQPGLFWYGIHSVEMLYTALGVGCEEVWSVVEEDHEVIIGRWSEGRLGVLRGNRTGNGAFGIVVHRPHSSHFADISKHPKPFYAGLLESVIPFFQTGEPAVDTGETLEIIRFIEAANESRETGRAVCL